MMLPRILMAAGVLIALLPFLGIPLFILRFIFLFLGLGVILAGYSLRARHKRESQTVFTPEQHTL